MTIDYVFLKRIVNTMRDMPSYIVNVNILMDSVRNETCDKDDREYAEKFYGHMLLIRDTGAIEELTGHNLGVTHDNGTITGINDCSVRLTALGYDLCEMLNQKGIIERIKRIGISTAGELAKIVTGVVAQQLANKINL